MKWHKCRLVRGVQASWVLILILNLSNCFNCSNICLPTYFSLIKSAVSEFERRADPAAADLQELHTRSTSKPLPAGKTDVHMTRDHATLQGNLFPHAFLHLWGHFLASVWCMSRNGLFVGTGSHRLAGNDWHSSDTLIAFPARSNSFLHHVSGAIGGTRGAGLSVSCITDRKYWFNQLWQKVIFCLPTAALNSHYQWLPMCSYFVQYSCLHYCCRINCIIEVYGL